MAHISPRTVVITAQVDAHLSYVQKHLDQKMFVIDPMALVGGEELSYDFADDCMMVSSDGTTLDAVRSVWYRKPIDPELRHLPVKGPLAPYSLGALHAHTRQLLSAFKDAYWMSNYYAIFRSSNKTYQLEVAKEVGFRVPRTLITSSRDKARDFILSQDGDCIVKPYMAYATSSKEFPKSFLTTKINAQKMPDLTNLHLAPAIFQEAIDSTCDIRATVVGDEVFAARIHTTKLRADVAVRDWRMGYYQGELTIEPYDNFPVDIAGKCVMHAKSLGLTFSAIDLVEDTRGNFWFLENNPNGQWAFVEEETGLSIGKAVARQLASGKS